MIDDISSRAIVSIIVVSFNTRELTLACLRSIFSETKLNSIEVIIVDNASTDGSATAINAAYPKARLIASEKNLGFAAANNLAAAEATGKWLLLLNPDTVVLDRAVDTLVDFAIRHREGTIFGGRTLFPNGSLNPSSCWARPTLWSSFACAVGLTALFRGSRLFDPEAMGGWERDTVRKVDIVTGCFFLLRKSDWDALHGFDPIFFMYGEEADMCLRAGNLGLTCLICPDAEIIHYGGASEPVRADKIVRLFRARALLYARHWGPPAAWLGVRLLDLWALVRIASFAIAHVVGADNAEALDAWRRVWRDRHAWRTAAQKISFGRSA